MRDSKLKRAQGPKLFRRLQECVLDDLLHANRKAGRALYHLAFSKPGFLNVLDERSFRVERSDRRGPQLIVTYSRILHTLRVACGTKEWTYSVVVDEDGNLLLETFAHVRKTIEELQTEVSNYSGYGHMAGISENKWTKTAHCLW
jgi:hypothetical protein